MGAGGLFDIDLDAEIAKVQAEDEGVSAAAQRRAALDAEIDAVQAEDEANPPPAMKRRKHMLSGHGSDTDTWTGQDVKDWVGTPAGAWEGTKTGLLNAATSLPGAIVSVVDPFAPWKRKLAARYPEEAARGALGQTNAQEAARWRQESASKLGINTEAPEKGLPRWISKGTEEVAAMIIPSTLMFRGMKRLAAEQRNLSRITSWFQKNIAVPIAKNPKAFAVSEATAATSAGAFRAGAEETPAAQGVAAVVGSFGPAIAIAPLRVVRFAWRSAKGVSTTTTRGMDAAARRVQEAVPAGPQRDAAIAQLTETVDNPPSTNPNYNPTSAQASRDPGINALEHMEGGLSERIARVHQRLRTEKAAVEDLQDLSLMNRTEHGVESPTAQILEEAEGLTSKEVVDARLRAHAEAITAQVDEEIPKAQQRIQMLVDEVADVDPELFPHIRSETINKALKAEGKVLQSKFDDLYKKIGERADAIGLQFTTLPVKKALLVAEKELGQSMRELIPEPLRKLINNFNDWESFHELRQLSKRLNDEAGIAKRAGNRMVGREIGKIKKSVDDILTSIEEDALAQGRLNPHAVATPDQILLSEIADIPRDFKDANRQFGAFAERFREGVAGKVLTPKTDPPVASATLDIFLHPGKGGKEAAESLVRAVEPIPGVEGSEGIAGAMQLAEDFLINKAFRAANNPKIGGLDAEKLTTFLETWAGVLSVLPARVRDRIKNVRSLQLSVDDLQIGRTASLDEFQEAATGMFLNGKPREAVQGVMTSTNPVKGAAALKRAMGGDPDAEDGLLRLFMSEIYRKTITTNKSDVGPSAYFVQPEVFGNMLDEYGPVIRALSSEEHVKDLRKVHTMAANAASGRTPSLSMQKPKGEQGLLEGLSGTWAYMPIWSPRARIIRAGMDVARFIKNLDMGKSQALMDEAILTPALMRDMLTRVTPGNQLRLIKRYRTHLWTLGYRDDYPDEDPRTIPDQLKERGTK